MKIKNVTADRTIIVPFLGTFKAVFPGETEEVDDIEGLSALKDYPAELEKVEEITEKKAKTKIEPDVR